MEINVVSSYLGVYEYNFGFYNYSIQTHSHQKTQIWNTYSERPVHAESQQT